MKPHPPHGNSAERKRKNRAKRCLARIRYYRPAIEVLGIVVILCYTGAAFYQGCETKRSAVAVEVGNRPYIGVSSITDFFSIPGWQGDSKDIRPDSPEARQAFKTANGVTFTIHVKNFGPVPGTSVFTDLHGWLGASPIHIDQIPNLGSIMFPTEEFSIPFPLGGSDFSDMSSGNKPFVIELGIKYDGPNGHNDYCERESWDNDRLAFFDLGGCLRRP